MTVEDTLAERETTHGDFQSFAMITQRFKRVVHSQGGWGELSDFQREAVEMILHKLGRVLAGDPDFPDHWHDIAGYAQLVERIVSK